MITETRNIKKQSTTGGFSVKQVIGMIIASMCIAIIITAFSIKIFLFPAPFKPVVLSEKEEQQLTTKLEQFDSLTTQSEASSKEPAKACSCTFRLTSRLPLNTHL